MSTDGPRDLYDRSRAARSPAATPTPTRASDPTPKPETSARKPPAAPGEGPSPRLVVRCRGLWLEWVWGLAEHCRVDVAVVVEQALIRYAEGVAYNEPPPRRLGNRGRADRTASARRAQAELRAFFKARRADRSVGRPTDEGT